MAAVIGKLSVGAVFLLFLPLPWTDEVGWKDGGAAALLLLLLPLLMYPKQAGESWVQGGRQLRPALGPLGTHVEQRLLCYRDTEPSTQASGHHGVITDVRMIPW